MRCFLRSYVLRNVTIFLFICFVVSKRGNASNKSLEGRIVGGVPVPVEKYPFSVKFYNFGSMCAGTILNSWSILTAAHCFDNSQEVYDMMIEVGTRYIHDSTGDLYAVLHFVIHNDYNKAMQFSCDVALIFVTQAIKLGSKAKRALLVDNLSWMNSTENNIFVSGWGWTKYGGPLSNLGLLETHLTFVPIEECERLHRMSFTSDMFCLYGAGERDTCKGDSGGAVMWNDMVIGVVSHGDGCAKRNKPSVYANVWYFRQWIESQIKHFFLIACELLEARNKPKLSKL